MAHEKTKTLIVQNLIKLGRLFIAFCGPKMGLTKRGCGTKTKRFDTIFYNPEVSIRYEGLYSDNYGKNIPKSFGNDGIFIICPGRWGLNYKPEDRKVIYVGIEIKENKEDLNQDTKCLFYLGWTDFYFFVVPQNLEKEAMEKIARLDDRRFGLITFSENGEFRVIIMAERQIPPFGNIWALSMDCYFKYKKYTSETTFEEDEESSLEIPGEIRNSLGIHEEYNGHSDNYVKLVKAGICDERGRNCKLSGITAPVFRTKDEIENELKNNLDSIKDAVTRYSLGNVNKTAQRVYFSIRSLFDKERSSITTRELASEINVSLRAIERAIKTLRSLHLVEKENNNNPSYFLGKGPSTSEQCPLLAGSTTKKGKNLMEGVCKSCTRECSAHNN